MYQTSLDGSKSIETLLEFELHTARSKNVSPLKFPIATEHGVVPTAKLVAVHNIICFLNQSIYPRVKD